MCPTPTATRSLVSAPPGLRSRWSSLLRSGDPGWSMPFHLWWSSGDVGPGSASCHRERRVLAMPPLLGLSDHDEHLSLDDLPGWGCWCGGPSGVAIAKTNVAVRSRTRALRNVSSQPAARVAFPGHRWRGGGAERSAGQSAVDVCAAAAWPTASSVSGIRVRWVKSWRRIEASGGAGRGHDGVHSRPPVYSITDNYHYTSNIVDDD